MADSFLVLVPHKTLHGTISILIQRPKLATNVGKMGAVKNKMPFIPQCPGPAQSAAAEMPGDGRFSKPTLFHRQGMRPHAELHQQPYPGNGHWKLKVRHSSSADWDAETMQSMCRVLPFWRELFLGTHADHPKRCWQPRRMSSKAGHSKT